MVPAGTFFNTAVVQMSEATAHLLLALAQNPDVQRRLVAEPEDHVYADRVIDESLRRYPLFGIAHRIATDEIVVGDDTSLPAGSVLCFNYPEFHATGYQHPEDFDPDRWQYLDRREANHIPFGVTTNRPCPARGVAPPTMQVVAREVLRRFELNSSVHTPAPFPAAGRACWYVGTAVSGLGGVLPCWRSCGSATGGRTCGAAQSSSSSAPTWWSTPAGNALPSGTSSRTCALAGRRRVLTSIGEGRLHEGDRCRRGPDWHALVEGRS